MVEFRILGPVSVADGDVEVELPAGRQRDLLALLAVFVGKELTFDHIVDALWTDSIPAHPKNALQQQMSGLRRLLDAQGANGLLVTTARGYRLETPADSVDAPRFERLVNTGHDAVIEGRYRDGVRIIAEGLELWRGSALAGVRGEWAAREADRLGELRTAAIEDRVEAELAIGRHSILVPELMALVSEHPLRERLRGQLMIALAACGRQADALQVYAEVRALLGDELGIDPSPELQRIYSEVLLQRTPNAVREVAEPQVEEPDTAAVADGSKSAEPTAATLFGREEAELGLVTLLGQERLITVTGVGGSGKTRLAAAAAERYVRQNTHATSHMVRLSTVQNDEEVIEALGRALGIATDDASTGSALHTVFGALGGKEVLLVLDSCEHAIGPARSTAEQVIAACPNVTVLATSREPLESSSEVVFPISGLTLPSEEATEPGDALRSPAVALFCQRVGERIGGYRLEWDDCTAVIRTVRRLDGLPLPIELAAGLVPILSVTEVADSLDSRFTVLASRSRSPIEDRHRTFAAAIDWSWQLLDETERASWMALSAFSGSFSREEVGEVLDAAEAVANPLQAITALVHRSLLTTQAEATTTRYRMLESIREYGRLRLAESERAEAVRMAHAHMVETELAKTDRCTMTQWSVDVERQRALVDEARGALRTLLDAGENVSAQRVAAAMGWYWYLEGSASEGIRWLDEALGPIHALRVPFEPAAALWAAGLRTRHPDGRPGEEWAQIAIDGMDGPSQARRTLGEVFLQTHRALAGNTAAALVAVSERQDEGWLGGTWRLLEAQLLAAVGRFNEAEPALLQAEEMLIANGAWWGITASSSLVQLAQARGDAAAAARAGVYALQHTSVGTADHVRIQLSCLLAMIEQELGHEKEADEHLAQAQDVGYGPTAPRALVESARGYVMRRRGDKAGARAAFQRCVRLHDAPRHPLGRPLAFWCLGHLALADGALNDATRQHEAGYEAAQDSGVGEAVSRSLEGLASLAAARGFPTTAARFLGAAHSARRPFDGWPVIGGKEARHTVEHVRGSLTAQEWQAAFQDSKRLDDETIRTLIRRLGGP